MHLVVVGHATHTPSTLIISEVKFSNIMKQDKLSICLVNAIFFYISGSPSTRGNSNNGPQKWNLREDCSKGINYKEY